MQSLLEANLLLQLLYSVGSNVLRKYDAPMCMEEVIYSGTQLPSPSLDKGLSLSLAICVRSDPPQLKKLLGRN